MDKFIIFISIAPLFVILVTMGIVVWKTSFLYDFKRGGWKPGINLPHLFAKEGDVIDHDRYKRFVGLSTIIFGFLLSGYLGVLTIYLLKLEESSENDPVSGILLYLGGMYVLVFAFIYILYGPMKERYIKRVFSKPPTYQKYIFALIISIFIIVIGSIYVEYLGIFSEGLAALTIIPLIITLIFFFIFKMFNYYEKEEYFIKLNLDINKFKRMILITLSLLFLTLLISIIVEYFGWLEEGVASIISLGLILPIIGYMLYFIITMYKKGN